MDDSTPPSLQLWGARLESEADIEVHALSFADSPCGEQIRHHHLAFSPIGSLRRAPSQPGPTSRSHALFDAFVAVASCTSFPGCVPDRTLSVEN